MWNPILHSAPCLPGLQSVMVPSVFTQAPVPIPFFEHCYLFVPANALRVLDEYIVDEVFKAGASP